MAEPSERLAETIRLFVAAVIVDVLAAVVGAAQGFGYLQNDVYVFPSLVAIGAVLIVAGVTTTAWARRFYRWLFSCAEWRQLATTGALMTVTMAAGAFAFVFLQLIEFHRVRMAELRNEPAPPVATIPPLPPPPPLVAVALVNPLVAEASWSRVGLELENQLLRRQLALFSDNDGRGVLPAPQQDPPTPPDRFGPATQALRERLAVLPPIAGCETIGRDDGPLEGSARTLFNQIPAFRTTGAELLVRLRASPARDDVDGTRDVVRTWMDRVRGSIENALGQTAEYDFRRSATSPTLWNELTEAERKALTNAETVYREATGTLICLDVLLTNLKARG